MKTSATRNSWTLIQNAATILGSDAAKISPLKNASRTAGQFGAFVTTRTISPNTMIVLASAIMVERTASPGGIRRRRDGWLGAGRRPPSASRGPPISDIGCALPGGQLWLEDRRVRLVGQPRLRQLVELAAVLERRDGRVDAARESTALLEQDAVVLGVRARGSGELADDHGVVDLGRRHVERCRQVDDEAVDLLGLQRRDRVVVRVVDHRRRGRGDDVVDRVEAGGRRLGAE